MAHNTVLCYKSQAHIHYQLQLTGVVLEICLMSVHHCYSTFVKFCKLLYDFDRLWSHVISFIQIESYYIRWHWIWFFWLWCDTCSCSKMFWLKIISFQSSAHMFSIIWVWAVFFKIEKDMHLTFATHSFKSVNREIINSETPFIIWSYD